MKIKPDNIGQKQLYETQLNRPLVSRTEFIQDLKTALRQKKSFGAGRAGVSEQFWMYYPILLKKTSNQTKIRVFEKFLHFHGFAQSGIFPSNSDFYLKYNSAYIQAVRDLDVFGMILEPVIGIEIMRFYALTTKIIYFKDLIPDRSIPANEENCYLHLFKNKQILLICPFADFLRQRAKKEIFEGVWSRINKPWFYPDRIDALEFPYGFDRQTQKEYGNAFELLEFISSQLQKKSFDIALVAAGGLSVPIVSKVKQMGRIAISLGGDLQILFGVKGKRWRDRQKWKNNYFNEWWVDMPDRYKPENADFCEGAYW